MSKAAIAVVPLVFVLLGLPFGSQQMHWDTLERASLLEEPRAFWRSWDGSPRSQFLSFAHVLELPLATLMRPVAPQPNGLNSLVLLEVLCAVAALVFLALLVRDGGASLATAIGAQAVLATTWGFWKMGTSGEERILGLATALWFLWCYARMLRHGRGAWIVALSLALAVLSHLSNAVLVPFSLLGVWLMSPMCAHRRGVLRASVAGAAIAGVCYVLVAVVTTSVRSPLALWNYVTFFHRDTGNDFFTATFSWQPVLQSLLGVQRFFADPPWAGILVTVLVCLLFVWGAVRARSTRGVVFGWRHLVLLCVLWSAHFAFYEPGNIESWTLVVACLVLGAGWALPRPRQALVLAGIAVLLLGGSAAGFQRLHQPLAVQRYYELVVAASDPDDIVLMGGGIQNGRPLQNSLATRFFLAHERQRTIVSLYDVMQITQPEFWGRPIESIEALQAQIDAGRRVWSPGFLRAEFDRAQASGAIRLQVVSHSDSLFEITGVSRPPFKQ